MYLVCGVSLLYAVTFNEQEHCMFWFCEIQLWQLKVLCIHFFKNLMFIVINCEV